MQLKTKIEYILTRPFFLVFSYLLKKYKPNIYFLDNQKILSKRSFNDNFFYMFNSGDSCDATPMMTRMNPMVKNKKIAFDVGANIGITSIWLSRNHKKVFAFEPQPENYDRLIDNCLVNNCKNVSLIKKAVSNKNKTSDFFILNGYGHHSLGKVSTSKLIGKRKVKTIKLDSFCKKNKINQIDTLKIDVEGFEHEVLLGSINLLSKKNIKTIIFEISKVPLNSLNKDPNDIINLLKKYKYQVYDMNNRKIKKIDIDNVNHQDYYAI